MKTTLKYLIIAAIFAASPASISFGKPLPRFRILIDTDELNNSEISSGIDGLAVDGVWAVTQNNCGLECQALCLARDGYSQTNPDVPPSVWPGVLAALNAASWTVTEDEAIHGPLNLPPTKNLNNNDYVAVSTYIGRQPDESLPTGNISPFPIPSALTLRT